MKKELLVELNDEELETVNGGQLEYITVDWEVIGGGLAGFGGGAGGGGLLGESPPGTRPQSLSALFVPFVPGAALAARERL